MKPSEVEKGGYYVMHGGGVIRHFYDLTPRGKVIYRAYDMQSGELIHTCTCCIEFLVHYGERKATTEEVSRLQEWKPYKDSQRHSLGKALRRTSDKKW